MQEQKETFAIANAANRYARSIANEGLTRLEANEASPEAFAELFQRQSRLRRECEPYAPRTETVIRAGWGYAEFKRLIQIICRHEFGNCQELSYLVINYILDECEGTHEAELVILQGGGDHAFVVIDRDPSSDPAQPTTWGNAVVVDAWANEVYASSQIDEKLSSYVFCNNNNPRQECKQDFIQIKRDYPSPNSTEPYDPDKHTMFLMTSISTRAIRRSIPKDDASRLAALNVKITALKNHSVPGIDHWIEIIKFLMEYPQEVATINLSDIEFYIGNLYDEKINTSAPLMPREDNAKCSESPHAFFPSKQPQDLENNASLSTDPADRLLPKAN